MFKTDSTKVRTNMFKEPDNASLPKQDSALPGDLQKQLDLYNAHKMNAPHLIAEYKAFTDAKSTLYDSLYALLDKVYQAFKGLTEEQQEALIPHLTYIDENGQTKSPRSDAQFWTAAVRGYLSELEFQLGNSGRERLRYMGSSLKAADQNDEASFVKFVITPDENGRYGIRVAARRVKEDPIPEQTAEEKSEAEAQEAEEAAKKDAEKKRNLNTYRDDIIDPDFSIEARAISKKKISNYALIPSFIDRTVSPAKLYLGIANADTDEDNFLKFMDARAKARTTK